MLGWCRNREAAYGGLPASLVPAAAKRRDPAIRAAPRQPPAPRIACQCQLGGRGCGKQRIAPRPRPLGFAPGATRHAQHFAAGKPQRQRRLVGDDGNDSLSGEQRTRQLLPLARRRSIERAGAITPLGSDHKQYIGIQRHATDNRFVRGHCRALGRVDAHRREQRDHFDDQEHTDRQHRDDHAEPRRANHQAGQAITSLATAAGSRGGRKREHAAGQAHHGWNGKLRQ